MKHTLILTVMTLLLSQTAARAAETISSTTVKQRLEKVIYGSKNLEGSTPHGDFCLIKVEESPSAYNLSLYHKDDAVLIEIRPQQKFTYRKQQHADSLTQWFQRNSDKIKLRTYPTSLNFDLVVTQGQVTIPCSVRN